MVCEHNAGSLLVYPARSAPTAANSVLACAAPPHRNYIIFFRYSVDAVEIVNILHGNRDIGRFYDSG